MANYYENLYNTFLENTQKIYNYLSGDYMNEFEGELLNSGVFDECIPAMKFTEICKFRKMENDQLTFEIIKNAVESLLTVYHSNSCAVSYFLVSIRGRIRLFMASEVEGCIGFDEGLKSAVPDLHSKSGFIGKTEMALLSNYGGVITGIFSINKTVMDAIIDVMEKGDCILGIIALPVPRIVSERYEIALTDLHRFSDGFSSVDSVFGSGSRVSIRRHFPGKEVLDTFLAKQCERISGNLNAMWKTSLWFGAKEYSQAQQLGSIVSGILSANDESKVEKGRCFYTTQTPFSCQVLGLTNASYSDIEQYYTLDEALKKGSLYSLVNTNELAGLFQLPMRGHVGIDVVDTNVSVNNIHSFSVNVPKTTENSFDIGQEVSRGQKYSINFDDLREHVLVTGGSGGGKSNTMMVIIEELAQNKTPFCVIESAKKEYWYLIEKVKDLKIYSPDNDALPLRFNPLEPEEGILIADHIDAFMYAFSGAVEMDEATKDSVAGLLKYTYKRYGWEEDEVAYPKNKKYPTIKSLIECLYEYSESGIRSGQEVKMNIEGAVLRRLEKLSSGTVGRITRESDGLTGRQLCNDNIVIELDSLSIDVKPFIATMLIIKMNQYIRRGDSARHLKNVIILEEAHNVLAEISENRAENSKDISSRYISNLLSEIRDYGTGMIIVDQGASQINSNAVANTKIKITHSLAREQDARAEAFALHLNEYQLQRISELETGDALIAVRGDTGVCKVRIRKTGATKQCSNYGCMHCKYSRLCCQTEVEDWIGREGTRYELTLSRVCANKYNPVAVKEELNLFFDNIGLSQRKRECALGYMLAHTSIPLGEREKRGIMFSYVY